MEEKRPSLQYSLILGIFFGAYALENFIVCIQWFSVWTLLRFVANAAIATLFILKKHDKYLFIPFALLTLLQLHIVILRFDYIREAPLSNFYFFINLIAYVAPLGIAIKYFKDTLPKAETDTQSTNEATCIQYSLILGILFGAEALRNFLRCFQGAPVWYLLWFIAYIAIATLFILKKHDKYLFIPFALLTLLQLRDFILNFGYITRYPLDVFSSFLYLIAYAAMFGIAIIGAFPKARTATRTAGAAQTTNEAYCDLVKHILLLLFTGGIWALIWIYRMTGYTNAVEDEEHRDPTNKLLLCIFVPFYFIYWTYKTAQRVDKMAAAKGVSSDLSTLCLIFAIFVPIIPPILLQEKMNSIVTADGTRPTAQSAPNKNSATLGTAEELKTYKELLDSGVITQEEFDEKKKQLLGL